MTMHKRRDPRSFDGAVTRILGVLGDEACSEAVGKSASMVRRWADPDIDAVPNARDMLALDTAYVNAGEGEPPILRVYTRLLDAAARPQTNEPEDLDKSIYDTMGALGRLSDEVAKARCSTSPGGRNLTANEVANLRELRDLLAKEVEEIDTAIDGAAALNLVSIPHKGKVICK